MDLQRYLSMNLSVTWLVFPSLFLPTPNINPFCNNTPIYSKILESNDINLAQIGLTL